LVGDGAVEHVGEGVAVGGREGGGPLLFQGVTFVASEAVKAFQIYDVGATAGGEGGENRAKEFVNGGAGVLGHVVAGDEAGESAGGGEGFVAAAEAGFAVKEADLFDEPVGAAIAGAFEEEGGFVEEVEGDVGSGRFFRDALVSAHGAFGDREDRVELKRLGGGAFAEDQAFKGEGGTGHGEALRGSVVF
jgi:hypothetical protein